MTIFLILVFLVLLIPTTFLGLCFSVMLLEFEVKSFVAFFIAFLIPAIPTAVLGWIIFQRLTGDV